jgi:hypothetical protein
VPTRKPRRTRGFPEPGRAAQRTAPTTVNAPHRAGTRRTQTNTQTTAGHADQRSARRPLPGMLPKRVGASRPGTVAYRRDFASRLTCAQLATAAAVAASAAGWLTCASPGSPGDAESSSTRCVAAVAKASRLRACQAMRHLVTRPRWPADWPTEPRDRIGESRRHRRYQ